ncbi:helix-turn-helix domain-containing protein [Nocardiopsis sp. RSe5-2]|uniref:Helix-turn-helix domain-containing protein n=1 Tax=Nocardiopsis endophytica TaxID=3018445 RepID=A0ABT4U501_9ACTN|nr:helix-turn-helix domain-containing protein [Nocardiopsis endophytica]MDA2811564.1 helix-turn-helix domain-containing protein [Nocardiopsis endophytica]
MESVESAAGARTAPAHWRVARPGRPVRQAGLDMAGFTVPGAEAVRMVPHPAVALFLEFGSDRPSVEVGGRRYRGSVAAGPGAGSGGGVMAWGRHVECLQVRLSPALARAVLGVPPGGLEGAVALLDDLWGAEAGRIRERLAAAPSWRGRFALAEEFVARRCAAARPAEPEVAWAWSRIAAARGRVRVEALAAEVGWSRKRLWSRFRSQIGLPPKRAAALVRFDRSAHRLAEGGPPAQVAAECGYFDQSHLHREVAAFAGEPPSALAGEPWLRVDGRAWPGAAHGGRPRGFQAPRTW